MWHSGEHYKATKAILFINVSCFFLFTVGNGNVASSWCQRCEGKTWLMKLFVYGWNSVIHDLILPFLTCICFLLLKNKTLWLISPSATLISFFSHLWMSVRHALPTTALLTLYRKIFYVQSSWMSIRTYIYIKSWTILKLGQKLGHKVKLKENLDNIL